MGLFHAQHHNIDVRVPQLQAVCAAAKSLHLVPARRTCSIDSASRLSLWRYVMLSVLTERTAHPWPPAEHIYFRELLCRTLGNYIIATITEIEILAWNPLLPSHNSLVGRQPVTQAWLCRKDTQAHLSDTCSGQNGAKMGPAQVRRLAGGLHALEGGVPLCSLLAPGRHPLCKSPHLLRMSKSRRVALHLCSVSCNNTCSPHTTAQRLASRLMYWLWQLCTGCKGHGRSLAWQSHIGP